MQNLASAITDSLGVSVTNHIINDKHPDKMKKTSFIVLVITASFLSGFAFKTIITKQNKKSTKMKKVTGIGGIFFKCKDPNAINEWYKTHLGFDTSPYGTSFEWRQIDDGTKKGLTQW